MCILGLRGKDASPGLEFLQYVTPSRGRPSPLNLRHNDLVLTRTVIEVDDLDRLTTRLQGSGVTFISPAAIAVAGAPWSKGLMVKDPDGHAVLLVE